jgi:hypothetical protein
MKWIKLNSARLLAALILLTSLASALFGQSSHG